MVYKIFGVVVTFGVACSPVSQTQISQEPLTVGAVTSQSTSKDTKMSTPVSNVGNTAQDGQIAIKEEFDAAMKAGTKPALELFIRRHPNSPWTAAAQAKLETLN